ncbi:carbohydrate ABC transporter membrane protein 1, CUT1 family [Microlunatus sagamiharensis]|uniref:Carbohydrate ABC transporter membrane protein 1, CUT1 family n=1 Tax=Microlunatus sagamiharensis TaxID=546874 RepID=A0A1H2NB65_9ACTN|nr:sugar ABC transporter permease [Microlunatus sagamiharensis]SDV02670.1 carbohydrate ABC transporter membrane protein 1, CUT1 family [Microlunatus sagamiharensis]
MTATVEETSGSRGAPGTPGAPLAAARRGMRVGRRRALVGLAMASPAIVLIVAFFLVPLVMTFWISLHNWPLLGRHRFIGLDNYVRAVADPGFRSAMRFTLLYTVVITPVLFLIGLGMALLVRRKVRAARVFQSIWFMPVCIGLASGSFLWLYLGQSQIGPLFDLLRRAGLVPADGNIFAGTWGALLMVIGMVTWKVVGLQMLLLLSGLNSIPDDVTEAARIDGASRWQGFRFITLPLLRPTLALVLVFSVAGSLLAFDQFFIMTAGGPANSTITAVYAIYRTSFISFKLGYGAALSVFLMVVLAVVSAVQMLLLRNTDHG